MRPTQDRSGPVERRLRIALDANAAAYRRAVQTSAPGKCWDYLVLTAANEKQAEGYRQELALRARQIGPTGAFFPLIQRTLVVPDPPGRKIGSGGATLGAIRAVFKEFGLKPADLDRFRILLIHSGGMSQRLPMYSPLGKIFAPLPLLRPDGLIATLFDHLYLTLAGLPDRLGTGMLVLAGDVFLVFDHRHVTAPPAGVTAISMRVEAELGRGHGVFVTRDGRVTRTLQKASVEQMREAGATDDAGRVLIDTGLLFFDPERTRTLLALAAKISPEATVDLYEDMTGALAAGTRRREYLADRSAAKVRSLFWRMLHGVRFNLAEVAGEFLHLGTTRQFRDAMTGRDPSPAASLFQGNVLAQTEWDLPSDCRVYQSVLGDATATQQQGLLGRGSVVEHSIVLALSRIGAGSVVSQVVLGNSAIELGDDLLLFQVPVRTNQGEILFVQVVCGVEDDFKGLFADGRCVLFNRPIEEWLARHGVKPSELWRGVARPARTLWNARLFPATVLRNSPHVVLPLAGSRAATPAEMKTWRKLPRYSMQDVLAAAEPAELIAHREVVSAVLQTFDSLGLIRRHEDRSADTVFAHYGTPAAYAEAEFRLHLWGLTLDPNRDPLACVDRARAFWTASQLVRRVGHPDPEAPRRAEKYMRAAFLKVAEASEVGYAATRIEPRTPERPKLTPRLTVTATSPVRLDLAGGWSDTPPYCYERGGHVVNVAIDLDGRPPVTASVRTLGKPVLVVESHDLGRKLEVTEYDPAEIVDVDDPFALHKVALRMTGLLPGKVVELSRFFKRLGAGLHVTTEARVPKGSGLGTSSILAATLLAALHAACGRRLSHPRLIEQTLLLEQRLGTGGGWQDQVGGVAPAVKSTLSAPGIPQRPDIEVLKMSDALLDAFEERLVVYYSGQQRLARDILRRVMGRWLGREPAVLGLMDGLKQSAAALRAALVRGRWSDAAAQINRYWQIKKDLYAGSTTPPTDLLFLEMRDDYLAAGLAGAGGGGFAYFLCRNGKQAKRLRERLAEHSARPGSMGTVYETRINRTGLRIARTRSRPGADTEE